MFYNTALSFYPILFTLVTPPGLALLALTVKSEDESTRYESKLATAPLVGLAVVITLVGLAVHLGVSSRYLLPLVVVVDIASMLVLWRWGRQKWMRVTIGALVIGMAVFLLLISPLLMAGRFAVTGYHVNNDSVFHSIIPEYLEANGYNFPQGATDGFFEAANDKLVNQGYPDGWHQIVLLTMNIRHKRAYALLNLTEAFFLSLMAPVGFAWLRRAGASGGWAAFGGLAAAAGYLQLSYTFQGFAPQVAIIPFIYGSLFFFYEIIVFRARRYIPAAAVLLQASVAVYSFTILLWLGSFCLALVVRRIWLADRPIISAVDVVVVASVFGLAAVINPFTLTSVRAAYQMVAGWSAAGSMGNLISRNVPVFPISGIWFAGDHRLWPVGWRLWFAYAGAFLTAVLFLSGVGSKTIDRVPLAVLTVAVALPAIFLYYRASPYYFAKTIHIAAPLVALGATAGLYHLSKSGRRATAVFVAIVYVFAVAASDRAAIEFTPLTPADRFQELQSINNRYRNRNINHAVFVETGEDWGKYLLADLAPLSPFALSYRGREAPPARPAPVAAVFNDLDTLAAVPEGRYPLIIIAKSQDISLPPTVYRLDFSGRFYNVYKIKKLVLAGDVVDHRPFEIAKAAGGMPFYTVMPGRTVRLRLKGEFKSLFVSAYFWPKETAEVLAGFNSGDREAGRAQIQSMAAGPGFPVVLSVGGRRNKLTIGRLPSVYAVNLKGDSGAVLRVKNIASHPLRLDWVETVRRSYDQRALFSYNNENRRARQSIERLVSR